MLDLDKSLECESINQFLLENGLIEMTNKSPERNKKHKQGKQEQKRGLSKTSSLSSLNEASASNQDCNQVTRHRERNKSAITPSNRFFLNSFMNVLTTIALAVSLYLLLANVFLTFYKFQSEFPFSEILSKYECAMHDLTTDECNQINYFNYQYRKLKSEQNQAENEPLKINTTFFVY
jgi:hypothetical protein